jgi:hypothetical protein
MSEMFRSTKEHIFWNSQSSISRDWYVQSRRLLCRILSHLLQLLTDGDEQREDASALPGGAHKVVDETSLPVTSTHAGKQWSSFLLMPLPPRQHLGALIDKFFTKVDWFMMVFGFFQSRDDADLCRPYLKHSSEPAATSFSPQSWYSKAKRTSQGL